MNTETKPRLEHPAQEEQIRSALNARLDASAV